MVEESVLVESRHVNQTKKEQNNVELRNELLEDAG